MMESNREHLSSLMDGELDDKAQGFLLRRLSSDPEMTATWRRYHLVRACLHKEFEHAADLADRVGRALDSEPSVEASGRARWLRPVAGSAIAACVALVAIVGINANIMQRGQPEAAADQPGFVSQPSVLDRSFSQQAVPVSFTESSPADRQRINTLVLRHNQAVGGSGFVSYLPIVTGTPSQTEADADGRGEQREPELEQAEH